MAKHQNKLTDSLLIFRKEHTLRMVENRALRKIFGTKWDEGTGGD
jgi:hypothetical protein